MIVRTAAGLVLLTTLAACSQAQLDQVGRTLAIVSGEVTIVAGKIDSGARLAASELPLGCRITADIGSAATALSASGIVSSARRPSLDKAAAAAAALAASDLCQTPATNPISASLQIVKAVAAVRAAAKSSADLSASAVAAR